MFVTVLCLFSNLPFARQNSGSVPAPRATSLWNPVQIPVQQLLEFVINSPRNWILQSESVGSFLIGWLCLWVLKSSAVADCFGIFLSQILKILIERFHILTPCPFLSPLSNLFLFLRTVAAEVRKQVSREYGSPQLTKKRGGVSNPVSHLMFDLQEVYANRFKATASLVKC